MNRDRVSYGDKQKKQHLYIILAKMEKTVKITYGSSAKFIENRQTFLPHSGSLR